MLLVRVPLNVEDSLNCYRQALEKRPHCLQVLQHSRSLLVLLLTYTQSCEFTVDWIAHGIACTHHNYWNFLYCLCPSSGFATQLPSQSLPQSPQHHQSRCHSHPAQQSLSNVSVVRIPSILPPDLSEEEFSSPNAIYKLPVSPNHIPIITAAYSNSISKNTILF